MSIQSNCRPGVVVQINPGHGSAFDECFAVVDAVRGWGVIAYVTVPGVDGGRAPVRLSYDEISFVADEAPHWSAL